MYAVGRLISRGVYTVSAPFHPFGGAVDIIVVEQEDGSFKSSPWYIKFGKFQGVLKRTEKVVNISVNEVEADFHMYLDHKGEAYFLSDVGVEEEVESMFYPSSSGEETDGQSSDRRPMKSQSCDLGAEIDATRPDSVTEIDVSNVAVVARTGSRRSGIMGLVFGRQSKKFEGDGLGLEEDSFDVGRVDSIERAEIAADLLEVKWSTSLALGRHRKDNASESNVPFIPNGGEIQDLPTYDLEIQVNSLVSSNVENGLDHHVSREDIASHDHETSTTSQSGFQELGSSVEGTSMEISCSITDRVIGTLTSSGSNLGENDEIKSEMPERVTELDVGDVEYDEDGKGVASVISIPISENAGFVELEVSTKKLDEDKDILQCSAVSEEENGVDGLQPVVYCEASVSSSVGLDGSIKQSGEMLHLSCGGSEEVYVPTETLHETTELKPMVNSSPETGLFVAKESYQEFVCDNNCRTVSNDANILESGGTSTASSSFANGTVSDTFSQVVTVSSINVSVEDVESQSLCSVSGFNNPICQEKDEQNCMDKDTNLQHYSESVGDPQEFIDHVPLEATSNSEPEGSEDEQFLFSDLDEFQLAGVKSVNLISADHEEQEKASLTLETTEAVIELFDPNIELCSSPHKVVQQDPLKGDEDLRQKLSNCIDIPGSSEFLDEEVGRMVGSLPDNIPGRSEVSNGEGGRMGESLPNMWLNVDDMDAHNLRHSLGLSVDSNYKSSKWMLLRKEYRKLVKSEAGREHQIPLAQPTTSTEQILEELKDVPVTLATGETSEAIDASGGSWRLWPFPLKKSRSKKATQSAITRTRSSDAAFERPIDVDSEKNVLELKVNKKKVRAITPTSEQLASLNLKEGKNTITFTFSTAMLGKQQVDARIYLWRWDTRIVISDVDGTITKSDVLGQFMPMFGMDWSQTGVAHLFSAIKENGYQLLFLSARAISQAYHTRQFLFNLKQNGKALPDGPIVISPDGLFPSLFREVIRRAPHEFKIACLEDIRALFPPDCNPFYAGFGNRDTDEFSYLKVGIPKGKIFIINPQGQVVVKRSVNTKSYTSLHDLVNDMFPSMSSNEQEDYNSWNFWKMPLPAIDV